MFEKNCPQCNSIQIYKNKYNRNQAKKNNVICKKCKYLNLTKNFDLDRNCPECNQKITYKTTNDAAKANRNNTKCKECVSKSQLFKDKMSNVTSGKNNAMYGKSVYSIWVDKYGQEEANIKLNTYKQKQSINTSGNKNPMYGKPSPIGSGNGWKGWYKNNFFRSLRELCFMIELDNRQIPYSLSEKTRIKYKDYYGKDRTYAPDFKIDNKLIEIKPVKLHNSPNNLLKFEAAKIYCKQNNLDFWVIDVKIDSDLINQNINNIRFLGNYLERYEKWLKK